MSEFQVTKITLDKERRMKLTLRGINAFEQITGIDIFGLTDLQDLTPKELGALLWACLTWEDRELKLEDIPVIIEKVDGLDLVAALLECITNSMPATGGSEVKPETVPLEQPDPTDPQTGSGSGLLESTTLNLPKFLS